MLLQRLPVGQATLPLLLPLFNKAAAAAAATSLTALSAGPAAAIVHLELGLQQPK